jgi:hypothetical protein
MVACKPGGRRGSDASDLTSRGRLADKTGEYRQFLGVKKVSFPVLSRAQDAEKGIFRASGKANPGTLGKFDAPASKNMLSANFRGQA